jgi:hypothetical protein
VLQLGGDTYFKRGLAYFKQDRVSELQDFGDSVVAIVEGTEDYTVMLTARSGAKLDHGCSCPLGASGEFCKHCVAVALKWLDRQANGAGSRPPREAVPPPATTKKAQPTRITDADIAAALNAEDKAALVARILEWAEENDPLREKLTYLAALHKGPEAGAALTRKALERAIRVRRYIDYREMRGYARKARAAIDSVEELMKRGQAVCVMELCEAGLKWLAEAAESVDDSDGYISELMERLQDLHFQACSKVRPDPRALAAMLFQAEMNSAFGEWDDSTCKYAELLGEEGLTTYRSLAQAAWVKVPARSGPGGTGKESYYTITSIMERLAGESGNIEELVAVLERDLTSAHQYERIAKLYSKAGDHDKALAWAERGMKAMPGHEGAGLRRLVAEEYLRSDRHSDALRIVWVEFRDAPDLEKYKRLERFARAADDWEDWRRQALALVRKSISGKGEGKPQSGIGFPRGWGYPKPDHTLLVEIFLYEKRLDEAWAEAQAGGCYDRLWVELAEIRMKDHPADAKAVFMRLGEQSITRASGDYSESVGLLEKAAAAARLAGISGQFETELEALLMKNKARRNLLKLAGERRRFLYLEPAAK